MTRTANAQPNPLPPAGDGAGLPASPSRAGRGDGGGEGRGEGNDRIAQITSAQLFAGAVEVRIDHHGAVYRLKQTALGKLILTK